MVFMNRNEAPAWLPEELRHMGADKPPERVEGGTGFIRIPPVAKNQA